jgi:hypothetical protein
VGNQSEWEESTMGAIVFVILILFIILAVIKAITTPGDRKRNSHHGGDSSVGDSGSDSGGDSGCGGGGD